MGDTAAAILSLPTTPEAAPGCYSHPSPHHDSGTGPYTPRDTAEANTSICLLSPRAQPLFHSKPSADVPHVTSLCLQGYCRSTQVGVAVAVCRYPPPSPAAGCPKPTLLQRGSLEEAHQRCPSFESSIIPRTGTSPTLEDQFTRDGTIYPRWHSSFDSLYSSCSHLVP